MNNQRAATPKTIVDFSSSRCLTGSHEIFKHFHLCHTVDANIVKKNDLHSVYRSKTLLFSSLVLNVMNFVSYILTLTAMQLQNWNSWR